MYGLLGVVPKHKIFVLVSRIYQGRTLREIEEHLLLIQVSIAKICQGRTLREVKEDLSFSYRPGSQHLPRKKLRGG